VLCRWGYMLMADPEAALRETRRVLRDGGRVALSVWSAPERNPWASLPGRAMLEHTGAPPPDPTAPGIFALADTERTTALLRAAGLEPLRVEEVELRYRFADFAEYWGFITDLAGALAMALQAMPEGERAAVRERIQSAVASFRTDGGYEFPGVAVNVLARAPAR
jgi:SAM-dependent methyltransferase